jgi:hypothetical protein
MPAGKSEAKADDALGEVPPLPSPSATPDRVSRIARIVGLIERLKGTEDQETIIEDERQNLEAFVAEGLDASLTAKVKAILK